MVLNRAIKHNFDVFEPETNRSITISFEFSCLSRNSLLSLSIFYTIHEYVTSFSVWRDNNADVFSAW